MNRLFRRLASWSVERRWPSLLLIVLLSAAAVIGWKFTELQQLVLSDDAGSEAVDDDSQARRNRRRGIHPHQLSPGGPLTGLSVVR